MFERRGGKGAEVKRFHRICQYINNINSIAVKPYGSQSNVLRSHYGGREWIEMADLT